MDRNISCTLSQSLLFLYYKFVPNFLNDAIQFCNVFLFLQSFFIPLAHTQKACSMLGIFHPQTTQRSIRVVYRSASILQPFLILSIYALKTWSMSRIKKHFFNPLNPQERPEKPFWSLKPLHHSPRPFIKYVSLNIFFIPQPCIAFNCNSIPMHGFSLEIFDYFTTLKCNTSSHKQLV